MFPFRDHNPSRRVPYVTFAIIALNALLLIPVLFAQMNEMGSEGALFHRLGFIPAELGQSGSIGSLFTSIFTHAGILHFGGNMLFIWIFADNVEDQMGHVGFLIFYLACGVAATMGQYILEPNSPIPVVGASGAVAGVLAAYVLLFPKARVDCMLILIIIFKKFSIPAWTFIAIWLAMQFFGLLSNWGSDGGGVAYGAHIAGLVVGALLALPLWLRMGGQDYWLRNDYHAHHAPTETPTFKQVVRKGPWG